MTHLAHTQSSASTQLLAQFVKVFGPTVVSSRLGQVSGVVIDRTGAITFHGTDHELIVELEKQFKSLSSYATEKLLIPYTIHAMNHTESYDSFSTSHINGKNGIGVNQIETDWNPSLTPVLHDHIISINPAF